MNKRIFFNVVHVVNVLFFISATAFLNEEYSLNSVLESFSLFNIFLLSIPLAPLIFSIGIYRKSMKISLVGFFFYVITSLIIFPAAISGLMVTSSQLVADCPECAEWPFFIFLLLGIIAALLSLLALVVMTKSNKS